MKPLILIVTFVTVFIVMVTAMNPVLVASQDETGVASDPWKYTYIAGVQYDLWYPSDGYEICEDNVTINQMIHFNTNELVFWEDSGGDNTSSEGIQAWVVRYDSPNYWIFRDHPDASEWDGIIFHRHMGWWDYYYDYVSFEELLDSVEDGKNGTMASADFRLNTGFTVFIENDTGVSMETALYSNANYTVGVGWDWYNRSMAAASALDIISGILTFNLPNVHWAVTALIAAPIYTCTAFILFIAVIRVIPFIGD